MYVWPIYLGIASDFFQHAHLERSIPGKVRFRPSAHARIAEVPRENVCCSTRSGNHDASSLIFVIKLDLLCMLRRLLPSVMRLGCGNNPAHPEVRACDAYLLSYSNIYLRRAFIYLFVCVPAAGCIFPAITRNRVGSLLTRSSSKGGSVRAHGGD